MTRTHRRLRFRYRGQKSENRNCNCVFTLAIFTCLIAIGLHVIVQFWPPPPVRPAYASPKAPKLQTFPRKSFNDLRSTSNATVATSNRKTINRPFLIEDVIIVTPGKEPRYDEGKSLLIANGSIVSIFSSSNTSHILHEIPPNVMRARYKGYYVLPPLVDLQAIVPPDNILKLRPYFSLMYLYHGVTSVRESVSVNKRTNARYDFYSGKYPGPRKFYCAMLRLDMYTKENHTRIDNVITELKDLGFNCIQAHESMSIQTLERVKYVAEQLGMHLFGKLPVGTKLEEMLLPEILHFEGVWSESGKGEYWSPATITLLEEVSNASAMHKTAHTVAISATQQLLSYRNYSKLILASHGVARLAPPFYLDTLWHPEHGARKYLNMSESAYTQLQQTYDHKKMLVKRLFEAGANVFYGSDGSAPFTMPGLSLHREMSAWLASGIQRGVVWEMASTKAAQFLISTTGQSDIEKLGVIDVGAPADFLLYKSNPLITPANDDGCWRPAATVVSGRLFTAEDMENSIKRWRKFFSSTVWDYASHFIARRTLATQKSIR